jgi:hypothetical protein
MIQAQLLVCCSVLKLHGGVGYSCTIAVGRNEGGMPPSLGQAIGLENGHRTV